MNTYNTNLVKTHRDIYLPAIRFFSKRISTSILLPKISRFINRYLYKFGIGAAINRYENSFTIYSSFVDMKLYRKYGQEALFCNFGSGAFFHARWKNYDYPGQSLYYKSIQGLNGKDFIAINLCDKSLSIPEIDNSISLIYCSHTLEHLEEVAARNFLRECYRILKPGGILRVALPNTSNHFYYARSLNSQSNCSRDLKKIYIVDAAGHLVADSRKLSIEEINKLFLASNGDSTEFYKLIQRHHHGATIFDGSNPERHISYWDYEKLIEVCMEIDYTSIIPAYQGSSTADPFTNINIFDTTEPHLSFYADIIK